VLLRSQLLKGILDIAVLAVLDEAPSYGYAILTRLGEAGLHDVGDASVYGTLRRLEDAGQLRSRTVASDVGPARRYYETTAVGRARLDEGVAAWADLDLALANLFAARSGRRS
jgi:PadR family transcriptional regulator PadR